MRRVCSGGMVSWRAWYGSTQSSHEVIGEAVAHCPPCARIWAAMLWHPTHSSAALELGLGTLAAEQVIWTWEVVLGRSFEEEPLAELAPLKNRCYQIYSNCCCFHCCYCYCCFLTNAGTAKGHHVGYRSFCPWRNAYRIWREPYCTNMGNCAVWCTRSSPSPHASSDHFPLQRKCINKHGQRSAQRGLSARGSPIASCNVMLRADMCQGSWKVRPCRTRSMDGGLVFLVVL